MNIIKKVIRAIAIRRAQRDVEPLNNLVHLGSLTHGYKVPGNYLGNNSICYCVGAGTDISLDIELVTNFKAQVFIFDPMPYALAHFQGLVNNTRAGQPFMADNDEQGYRYAITNDELATITYRATGIWNEKKLVRFYSPTKTTYAGHSITNLQNTADYIEAPVDKLQNIMRELGHAYIDLLKLEIEGSEYTVIDNMLADKLDVRIVLVEFDEFHHRSGLARLLAIRHIEQSSRKLRKAGYKLVHSVHFYKRTFVRADVFGRLVN
jgi:FkbM family methyltransferase